MVIVDASVAAKWSDKNEADHLRALNLLEEHTQNKTIITVPDLILYELANVWATKSKLTLTRIKINLDDLRNANLQIEPATFGLIDKAIILAKKYNVSVYDATYTVMATEKKCNLITADEKFADCVKLPFVKKLSSISD